MSAAPLVRGWCPTAWRPMAAGDGLILRVRPRLGRVSREQMHVVADVARAHGSGLIDVTNRAALQLRGLRERDWTSALDPLIAAGLVDHDPVREGRAMLVAPDWRAGDDTHRIASALLEQIDALPPLPGKIGFAVDAGALPVLGASPADFRIERAATGALMIRPDGRPTGAAVADGDEAAALIALAHWFHQSGGARAGRMARHAAPLPDWASDTLSPASGGVAMAQGDHPLGVAIGLPFGRIDADTLDKLAALPGVTGLRLTPWRIVLVEGATSAKLPHVGPVDLSVDACVGAPACPQATVETRTLATRLAPHVAGRLHVSGCAKGCARAAPADVVVTGRVGRFDVALNARADDAPARSGLSADDLIAFLESHPDAA